MSERKRAPLPPAVDAALTLLVWAERVVFFAIGLGLFLAAVALLKDASSILWQMGFGGTEPAIVYGSRFLDVTLLVLMIVELAYTVILSLRGAVLLAEPFLIVGLIAVIRRMLVITVGEVGGKGGAIASNVVELAILTGVVIVFVLSIFLLRSRPQATTRDFNEEELLE